MKKVSTAATIESRNFSMQQKLTIGLDLGDRHSWYCVLDGTRTVQLQQRVRTSAKTLQEVFGAFHSPSSWSMHYERAALFSGRGKNQGEDRQIG